MFINGINDMNNYIVYIVSGKVSYQPYKAPYRTNHSATAKSFLLEELAERGTRPHSRSNWLHRQLVSKNALHERAADTAHRNSCSYTFLDGRSWSQGRCRRRHGILENALQGGQRLGTHCATCTDVLGLRVTGSGSRCDAWPAVPERPCVPRASDQQADARHTKWVSTFRGGH